MYILSLNIPVTIFNISNRGLFQEKLHGTLSSLYYVSHGLCVFYFKLFPVRSSSNHLNLKETLGMIVATCTIRYNKSGHCMISLPQKLLFRIYLSSHQLVLSARVAALRGRYPRNFTIVQIIFSGPLVSVGSLWFVSNIYYCLMIPERA